ncbi:hypothetical protein JQN72_00520 [Phycicoccus sp. CSK15P-2]|uniref:hypothetical protein n=1 Tax=Phycicoccus sp. CSK15P-2 TaxID=2807627 RepID=UPI00194DD389|nr:hypothetical protein [Phycicoccus sp. CSK15P-2]MBM6402727.1 hypothetical protein [Phycicoccus sp. CSK15P-2]
MSAFLLSVHVLAAIITIGPVAVAASMFPRFARLALALPGDATRGAVVRILHRITRVYAVVGALVPVFGIATGASIGVLGDAWLIVSMIVTVVAAALLVARVLPGQAQVVSALDAGVGEADDATRNSGAGLRAGCDAARRLAMSTGMFNLAWAIVVVLMIYRPGSTTGVGR